MGCHRRSQRQGFFGRTPDSSSARVMLMRALGVGTIAPFGSRPTRAWRPDARGQRPDLATTPHRMRREPNAGPRQKPVALARQPVVRAFRPCEQSSSAVVARRRRPTLALAHASSPMARRPPRSWCACPLQPRTGMHGVKCRRPMDALTCMGPSAGGQPWSKLNVRFPCGPCRCPPPPAFNVVPAPTTCADNAAGSPFSAAALGGVSIFHERLLQH